MIEIERRERPGGGRIYQRGMEALSVSITRQCYGAQDRRGRIGETFDIRATDSKGPRLSGSVSIPSLNRKWAQCCPAPACPWPFASQWWLGPCVAAGMCCSATDILDSS